MANPRIDDLRKRLERDPGSKLFAQLAEELRKDGALVEAIRVCQDGLQKHPGYSSARLTLGRCLVDSGDRRGAVGELAAVFKASPDNLLAGRLLAECQEALEDFADAGETYQLLVRLAPADKQLGERLAHVQGRAAQAASSPHAAVADMEGRFAPIALVETDEPFELERPGDPFGYAEATAAPSAPAVPRPEPAPTATPAAQDEMVFEFEGDAAAATPTFEPVFRPLDVVPAEPSLEPAEPESSGPALPVTLPGIMLTDVAAPALASPTLAELYQQQGATERAIETYREVLRREPQHAQARQRLAELLEQTSRTAGGPPSRRRVLERTIARLEAFAAVLQRG